MIISAILISACIFVFFHQMRKEHDKSEKNDEKKEFDMNAVNNFIDICTKRALNGEVTDPNDIAFIIDMYYIVDREVPVEFKDFAFECLNRTQHTNGFWEYKKFHYAPDTARKLLTYGRESIMPPHTISDKYYQSIDTWDEVLEEVYQYEKLGDDIVFWGGLWGYVTLWQLKGDNPPWLDKYTEYAYEDFDNWKLKNHERNHLVGTFLQICKDVPNKDELIDIIVKEQNPHDNGWGFTYAGEKSSSIETAHTLCILKALEYEYIDDVAKKSLNGILKTTYKTMEIDGKIVGGWSYYTDDERMDIRSTTIVLMALASLGEIEGNSDPYYIEIC